jgi:hydrogenase maturation protease
MNAAVALDSNSWVVVIGYGNALRSDDGVGPQVARVVAHWNLPGVRALAVHQLTPELAEVLAGASLAIFVDAAMDPGPPRYRVGLLAPTGSRDSGHTSARGWLLALARQLYGRTPRTRLVTISASRFDFGMRLKDVSERGMSETLEYIAHLVGRDSR